MRQRSSMLTRETCAVAGKTPSTHRMGYSPEGCAIISMPGPDANAVLQAQSNKSYWLFSGFALSSLPPSLLFESLSASDTPSLNACPMSRVASRVACPMSRVMSRVACPMLRPASLTESKNDPAAAGTAAPIKREKKVTAMSCFIVNEQSQGKNAQNHVRGRLDYAIAGTCFLLN